MSTSNEIAAKEQLLESMKTTIERFNKTQQIEILKIFKNNPQVKLNENRNGVYVNLSYLPDETVEEIRQYLSYVKDQENRLEEVETKKEEFKSTFFLSP